MDPDMLKDDTDAISWDQASARRYLSIPYHPAISASIGSTFSMDAAKTRLEYPFDRAESPFEPDVLQEARLSYHRHDSCRGTYSAANLSVRTNQSAHMSFNLGIGIGNRVLGASVSGEYDKSILEASQARQELRPLLSGQ
jgi:hypothetical protein